MLIDITLSYSRRPVRMLAEPPYLYRVMTQGWFGLGIAGP